MRGRARSTSRALTLPLPSQIEFSGDSRKMTGRPDSSTYPLPPRHSSASATIAGVRLQTQNFASGRAIRRSARSCSSSSRSTAAASRIARAVAASDSTARSATTFCMSGLSASRPPNAARRLTCQEASATARRIRDADPRTQSSRVAATISMIVGTPRPSSPRRRARRAPELQLRGCVRAVAELVLEPLDGERVARAIGQHAGNDEAGQPVGACARTRKTSFIGADVNHLWPSSR